MVQKIRYGAKNCNWLTISNVPKTKNCQKLQNVIASKNNCKREKIVGNTRGGLDWIAASLPSIIEGFSGASGFIYEFNFLLINI